MLSCIVYPETKERGREMSYTLYELLWLFIVYSFLGWCAGVCVAAVRRKRFINTGVLNLPFCPVYGASAAAFSLFLIELKHKPLFLFIGGVVIGAFITVVTGLMLERIFKRKWWDYSKYRIGFKGYITAPLLLIYGAAAVFVLWVGNPLLLKVGSLIPKSIGKIALFVICGLLALDLICALAVVWEWRRHIKWMSDVSDNMQDVSDWFGNAISSAVKKRLVRAYPNIETKKILAAKSEEKKEPEKEKRFAEGCGFYKLVWLFLIGALLGDLIETVFCRFSLGWWMSRSSVVYGPFSIVWGLACAILTAMMYKYKDRSDRYLFFYGTIVGGTYEYMCSVVTEILFGTVFWDYSSIPFNLGGRINLLFCFFWGIVAVVWVKFIYPFLSWFIERIPKKTGPILTWILIVLMVYNMALSALALGRYSDRQRGVEAKNEVEEILDERFPDERMERIYPKAKIVR